MKDDGTPATERVASVDVWLDVGDRIHEGHWFLGYLKDLPGDHFTYHCGLLDGSVGCGIHGGSFADVRAAMLACALHNREEHRDRVAVTHEGSDDDQ